MPIAFMCDGCGRFGERPDFEELGYAKKKVYCAQCAPTVKAYLGMLDEFHTRAACMFNDNRIRLQTSWKENFPNGSLPDV
jgi:hypothetical protein